MNSTSPSTIYKELTRLEKELQRLKIKAYRLLPINERKASPYSEKAIMKAAKETRDQIWQERYAQKVPRLR